MSKKYKHAVITGGSSGIGKAIARILVGRGTSIALIARTEEVLRETTDFLEGFRVNSVQKILKFSADVSIFENCFNAIHRAADRLGGADLLITSVGMARPGYLSGARR